MESQDIAALGTYIKDMTGIGVITPDDGLEDYVRSQANLPDRVDGAIPRSMPRSEEVTNVQPELAAGTPNVNGLNKLSDTDDIDAVTKARERLGRFD